MDLPASLFLTFLFKKKNQKIKPANQLPTSLFINVVKKYHKRTGVVAPVPQPRLRPYGLRRLPVAPPSDVSPSSLSF